MKKLFSKAKEYILPSAVLFLLAFIPLYPKLPLVDIQNTWVYIRVEDFLVFVVLGLWLYFLFKKEVTLKTPLTLPILAFWVIGAIATIHGVVIIFPTISNVFPNVALLAYLRHIEYLSVFFIAYSAVKSKKFVYASIWVVVATLLAVVAYGFGQKYLSFPAYLTMNEEYAKGIPIIISPLNRISSTFAGHYDLAAYLVLIIPILASLFFGFRNILLKAFMLLCALLGFVLLFMTVSRVSFFVLFIALFLVLYFYKKKLALVLTPIIIVAGFFFLLSQQSLLTRFGSTVKEVDVVVDAVTGEAVGHVTFYPRSYVYDKFITRERKENEKEVLITPLERSRALREGVPEYLIPLRLPREIPIVPAEITSTGETLPQGSGYINLPLSPVTKRLDGIYFEYPPKGATTAATVKQVIGHYLVKRASAYDLSFTTRFQGEWPNALEAFGRNILFGSGYGSVSLAIDNNYYRMLGETGLLGTVSFFVLFIVMGVYIKKVLPSVDSKIIKSLALGFFAGVVGLSLNAILIDVFEASKVAFQLWLLSGIVMGGLSLYQTKHFSVYKELLRALTSPYAIIVYFFLLTITIFSTSLSSYFIGDDFTWFRWAADCNFSGNICGSLKSRIGEYFFNSEGFFYRPGTKTYFLLMFPIFWLNQVVYHAVSIALHFIVVVLLYLLARKILKSNLLAAFTGLIFVIASWYLEMVVWISATGHLFSAAFIMGSLLLYIQWRETKNFIYFVLSLITAVISLLFYELGIITPFLALAYDAVYLRGGYLMRLQQLLKEKTLYFLFIPNVLYLIIRYISHTHWMSGDYSYNLLKLPFNTLGNIFGYVILTLFGPISYPAYEKIRLLLKSNIPVAVIFGIIFALVLYVLGKKFLRMISEDERKVIIFASLFFVFALIPYLGLGNITFRYSYLASFGVIIIMIIFAKKIFESLIYYGKDIAVASIAVLFTVFCLFHVIQTQQAIIEWNGSGAKVVNFLRSLESEYSNKWSDKSKPIDFYFSNVPIKNGNAWVFPVGMSDAVWFAFRNDNITIHNIASYKDLGNEFYSGYNKWVFNFQPDGSIRQVVWTKKGPVEYVE